MTIARPQSKLTAFGAVSSGSAAYGSACTVGSLLIATVHIAFGASATAVSDGTNGSWTKVTANSANIDGAEVSLWYKANNQSSATPTVSATLSAAAGNGFVVIQSEYTGLGAGTILDKFGGNFGNSVTSCSSGNVTTTGTDLLVGAWVDSGNVVTVTQGTGWSLVQRQQSSAVVEALFEDQGVGGNGIAAGTYAATCTTGSSDRATSTIFASFTAVTDPFPVGYHNEPPNEGAGQATYLRMHHREPTYDIHRRPSGLYAATRDWRQVARGLLRAT